MNKWRHVVVRNFIKNQINVRLKAEANSVAKFISRKGEKRGINKRCRVIKAEILSNWSSLIQTFIKANWSNGVRDVRKISK